MELILIIESVVIVIKMMEGAITVTVINNETIRRGDKYVPVVTCLFFMVSFEFCSVIIHAVRHAPVSKTGRWLVFTKISNGDLVY